MFTLSCCHKHFGLRCSTEHLVHPARQHYAHWWMLMCLVWTPETWRMHWSAAKVRPSVCGQKEYSPSVCFFLFACGGLPVLHCWRIWWSNWPAVAREFPINKKTPIQLVIPALNVRINHVCLLPAYSNSGQKAATRAPWTACTYYRGCIFFCWQSGATINTGIQREDVSQRSWVWVEPGFCSCMAISYS